MKPLVCLFLISLVLLVAVYCAIGVNVVVNGPPTWGVQVSLMHRKAQKARTSSGTCTGNGGIET